MDRAGQPFEPPMRVFSPWKGTQPAARSARRIALTWKEDLHRGFERLARPVHEMEAASWFLRRRSLPPGLAPDRRTPPSGPPLKPL